MHESTHYLIQCLDEPQG